MKTCKFVYRVVKRREVWHYILRQLGTDNPPRIPPSTRIESLSAETLREIVVHALRAGKKWNDPPPDPDCNPRPREMSFRLTEPLMDPVSRVNAKGYERFCLAPGGDFLFRWSFDGCVQCWHVSSGDLIWRYKLSHSTGDGVTEELLCVAADTIVNGPVVRLRALAVGNLVRRRGDQGGQGEDESGPNDTS